MKSKRIIITGKVQGVWFRKYTQEKAKSLGLSGEVWNNSDGSVEIEVVGPAEHVQSLIDWCQEGSPEARVSRVEVRDLQRDSWTQGFKIRH